MLKDIIYARTEKFHLSEHTANLRKEITEQGAKHCGLNPVIIEELMIFCL